MTQASARTRSGAGSTARSRPPLWAGPCLAGLAFGLAYGITQRLVSVNVGELIRFGQGFDVQVFPGTSLESLRLRFGADAAPLRGTLELQQLQRQSAGSPDGDTAPDPAEASSDGVGPESMGDDPSLKPTAEAAVGVEPAEPASPAATPPAPPPIR
jgi:hypothetical protein